METVVRYHGAVGGYGGSMIAVESNGATVLLDCGRSIRDPGATFPVDPSHVNAIVVTHAHRDHVGWLTEYQTRGFAGRVYVSAATAALLRVQFADSARWRPSLNPTEMGRQLTICPYGYETEIPGGLGLTLIPVGHLLGAVGTLLRSRDRSLFFTGDVGRSDSPLYPPPELMPDANLVIAESTYGDREAASYAESETRLGILVRNAMSDHGRVMIPAFSLGRTQLILAALHRLRARGECPEVEIVVDSATARAYSEVHTEYRSELREPNLTGAWDSVRYVESESESQESADSSDPCIIIASGGMADSERSRRHLRRVIDDPRCRVVLVSYQAAGTLGRRLLTQGPTVRMDGRNYNKWASIEALSGFSGHAGRGELLQYLRPAIDCRAVIRLVHGDPAAAALLAEALIDAGAAGVAVPGPADVDRLRPAAGVR